MVLFHEAAGCPLQCFNFGFLNIVYKRKKTVSIVFIGWVFQRVCNVNYNNPDCWIVYFDISEQPMVYTQGKREHPNHQRFIKQTHVNSNGFFEIFLLLHKDVCRFSIVRLEDRFACRHPAFGQLCIPVE